MIIFIISSLNLYADDVADVPHYTKFAKRQNIEIRGVVRDSIGNLPGVSIAVKGRSNIGTTTDANGKYLLSIPGADVILVFSMVGYETQEIPVKGQNVVNVEMKANNKGLDEVVVVAFGKQKKSEMVGSVTSIKPSELKVPSSNLTTALAGRAAGIIAYQRSGEPGQDNADFFIRGVTTFGYKTSPLILIDQIEYTATDLARLQVDDIASFSILKDATATALYGSRAANGVILVTTKQGREGPTQLAIRLENTISQPVRNVAFTDPVNYMRLANESVLTRNPLGITDYSEGKINNTELGMNPLIYPANDWRKIMFNDRTINQRVNLSLKGGGKVAQFFVSGALNEDHGLLKVDPRSNYNNNIDLKSYSLRSNVTMKLTKSTDMTVR
ncbi:MAG TPA: SusC/RagA family TonB-linked outer membrane protein, partial [Sphingobacteriaceae bacterium]|nr:SusC/RagA family TonB-linked outer membrane protein [Sphingobacteriaceae bacterium]